jgi:hypothetical protein
MFDFSGEAIWHRAGFRVGERLDVVLRIARHFDFEKAVLRAFLLHPHFVVTKDNVSVDDFLALGADGPSVGKERGVTILF